MMLYTTELHPQLLYNGSVQRFFIVKSYMCIVTQFS